MERLNPRISAVWMGLMIFLLSLVQISAFSSVQSNDELPKKTNNRVNIEHADNMEFNDYLFPGAHRLSGNVKFSHGSFDMYCDSAIYYTNSNSFEAIGNVRIHQGDTLTLVGDSLFYDGEGLMAQMRYNVILTHNTQKLYTDSLNYDRVLSVGYFFEGGKLVDATNELTSDFGEYYTSTKDAHFFYDVILRGAEFTITTDSLKYNTETKWSKVIGPSNIHNCLEEYSYLHNHYNQCCHVQICFQINDHRINYQPLLPYPDYL